MANEKKSATLTLLQKLSEISKSIDFLKKEADGYKFKYVAGIQILPKIKEKMDKLGLLLIPVITNQTYHNNGTIDLTMIMRWINVENSREYLDVSWSAFGYQKDPAQAFGSALTYSERYFLLKFFHIPTDEDDPDNKVLENSNSAIAQSNQPINEFEKVKQEIMAMANFLARDMSDPKQGAINLWKEAASFTIKGEKKTPQFDDINRFKPEKIEWLKRNVHTKLKDQIESLGFKLEDLL